MPAISRPAPRAPHSLLPIPHSPLPTPDSPRPTFRVTAAPLPSDETMTTPLPAFGSSSTLATAAPLIRLEGVKKVFLTDEVETHALSEIHLEVERGEYLAIAGPSGCGKTTLLSILGLLDTPSEGQYLLDGEPVASLSAAERARVRNRQIGFIFQAFNLIGDLTVYENVEL